MPIDYKKLYESHDIILTNANPSSLVKDGTLESVDYLKNYFVQRERFKPPVDFSDLKNFARFGSAKKYYVDAFDRIYETYPYDGSLKERVEWELSSSFFDMYVFEEVYPRTNGYVIISPRSWGTQVDYENGYGATATASYEYIFVKGGPNTSKRSKDKDIQDVSGDYKSGYANVWEPSKNRECNLKIGGIDGNTVEFWMKKSAFATAKTGKEVIFDASTSDFISSSPSYGRLTIEMTGTTAASPFRVTYMSGATGVAWATIGSSVTTSSVADNKWHHYAFVMKNTGSQIEVNFYVDGKCDQTVLTGSSVGYVSGNINATIGSLYTAPLGTTQPTKGWGKLSGSLDEFRFWKDKRSSAEIVRYMIEPVGGGTNTDDANTALGVYYKFNEGITQTSSIDRNILDYSGRISNGVFVGYSSNSRNIGSAMVSSSLVSREFKDPILYPFHPTVQSTLRDKKEEGQIHDYANNASIYHSLPAWITEEDEDKETSPLKNLTQIVGSYFDSLAEQINTLPTLKYKSHAGFQHKPAPFNDRLLQSIGFQYFPELFSDATELEYFQSRNDRTLFEQKLYDVKNKIYNNIYNNIIYINKTKGTEKSFRNMLHCFGVGDEIYRINTYGNRVTYELKDNYQAIAEYKKYVNFGLTGSAEGTVFAHSSSANSNSKAIISGTYGLTDYLGFTMESEVHFPIRFSIADTNTVATTDEGPSRQFRSYIPYTTASLFGMHQVGDAATGNNLTWASTDTANFQVFAIRASDYSQRAKFLLTGTVGSAIGALNLSSKYFDNVFNDTRWTFSVSVKPTTNANLPDGSSGSVNTTGYLVEFYGVEKIADYVKNEFYHTGTISADNGSLFLNKPKAPYIGAHRTNFSGSILQKADGNISSTRVWFKHLPTGTIQQHTQDVKNYGTEHPFRSTYLYPTALTGTKIPEIDTMVLNWTFDTVTGSDSSGQFIGEDYSSGSAQKVSKYGPFGQIVGKQYLPKGFGFLANSTLPINKKYVNSGKKQLPETITSADMVNILTDDDEFFNKGEIARPTNYYTSIEKSMYQTISDEMIKMFSTVKDFNNLVGEPVNKYRDDYKNMAKLRQMFYERVGNTPDLDKYVDFYKWIDLTLDSLLGYLIPMSSDMTDQYGSNIRTMVENTVLQRNKYRWKYPTLEDKTPTIEGNLTGINELLYDWEHGHAPLGPWSPWSTKSLLLVSGSGQALTVADTDTLSFGDGTDDVAFSIGFWIKWASTPSADENFFTKGNALPNPMEYDIYFRKSANRLRVQLYDGASTKYEYAEFSFNPASYIGNWTHVAITYSGVGGTSARNGIKLYVNGLAVATAATLGLGSYVAMENTTGLFRIASAQQSSAASTANTFNGNMDEVVIYRSLELSAAQVLALYNSGCPNDALKLNTAASLVGYWKMGEGDAVAAGGIKDSSGNGNNATPRKAGGSDLTIDVDAPGNGTCKVIQSTEDNCLWWNQRAEKSNAALSSSVEGVNADKQSILDSIVNDTNTPAPTLGATGSGGITTYAGSTYALRRLAPPLRLEVDESPLVKGGVNEFANKQTDLLTFIKQSTSGSYMVVPTSSVLPFEQCNDDLALNNGKRKQSFNSSVNNFKLSTAENSYFTSKGDLYAFFDIYSASISGGYHDDLATNFMQGVDLTNLHEDTYGPMYGRPVQGPFTEKFVGGKVYRHINSNLRPHNTTPDNVTNRIEGWRIMLSASSIYAFGSGYGNNMAPNPNLEKGSMFRSVMAKRPVNIENIKMFTGSATNIPGRPDQVLNATNIGNYSHNYDLIMTNGRSINNRYLAEAGALPSTYAPSTFVTGVIDFAMPRRDLTGSSDSIIVNRFSAPGSPATMGQGMLDLAAGEYSVYNSLPWRNLNVRRPLNEWYTDHTNQFGFFSDNQTETAYLLAGEAYIGGSSSVSAEGYDGTGSFHQVNRNSKPQLAPIEYHNNKIIYFNGTDYRVNIGTAATWDAIVGTAAGSTQSFTLSAWVHPTSLSHAGGNNQPRIFDFAEKMGLFVDNAGKINFFADFSTTMGIWQTNASVISTGEWAHVALTYDATSVANDPTIYVNGVSVAITETQTPVGSYNSLAGAADCFIGENMTDNRAWEGYIDEISVFAQECTLAEIKEIYYGTTGFDPTIERQGPGDLSKHSRVSRLKAWWGAENWSSGTILRAQQPTSLHATLTSFRMIKDNDGSLVTKLEGAVYVGNVFVHDNWFVQHQIPQTDLQYSWITASVINGYTGSALYGFEQPDYNNASLASTDITFCSASDFGSVRLFSSIGPTLLGRWFGASKTAVASSTLLEEIVPIDFAGMNINLFEPITASTNTVGYPQLAYTAQLGTSFGGVNYITPYMRHASGLAYNVNGEGMSSILNSLILHRQGPYGWPSWKQVRGAQHPVMRYNYKNNIQTFTKISSSTVDGEYVGDSVGIVSQIEPPITSKFNPLQYGFMYKSDQPNAVTGSSINMQTSYGNEKAYFTNVPDPEISNLIDLNNSELVWSKAGQIGETLQSADDKILAYDTLKKYLLWNTPTYVNGDANPIEDFHHMRISEGIYPREHYTYLSLVRERANYINNYWKDLRASRNLIHTNSQGYETTAQTAFWQSASIWSLDADMLVRVTTPGDELYSSGSEGELQNSYSIWHANSSAERPAPIPAATYNRRVPILDPGVGTFFWGQTEWEAGEQAGYNPSYNTYKEYVEDIKRIGKDYGIIPEYRISEHMKYHVVDKASDGGFLAPNRDWLSLTGAVISGSNDNTSGNGAFYTTYTNSDFLKYFQPIESDFSKVAAPTNLTLKCNAIMKFLPYDGFYPSERSVQLATLFSQSFAPSASLIGANANWRTLLMPFFSPGILYNSIKSGLAVDYPIYKGPTTDYFDPEGTELYMAVNTAPSTDRVPFEALVNPDYWLSSLQKIVDSDCHHSASINSTGSFGEPANDLYRRAMNNFVAEVPRFFLGGTAGNNNSPYGPMTTFASKETLEGTGFGTDPNDNTGDYIPMKADKTYKMRIVCSHSKIKNLSTLLDTTTTAGAARAANRASYIYNEPTIMMYNRAWDRTSQTDYYGLDSSYGLIPWFARVHNVAASYPTSYVPIYGSSFGPPMYAGGFTSYVNGSGFTGVPTSSFEAYTPPYYNGYSHIELSYKAKYDGNHTITDIISGITASYHREMITAQALTASGFSPNSGLNAAAASAMQLSESINWNKVVSAGSGKSRWVIQPKWECPVLDFTTPDAIVEGMADNRDFATAKGMWHQYGTIPSNTSGLFLEIQPGDATDDPDTVGDLAELLGFDEDPTRKIGQIPSGGKTVSEAVVAVPFYEDAQGSRNFFHIDRKTIDWAQIKLSNPEIKDIDYLTNKLAGVENAIKYKPAPSVVSMVQSMDKFVIPPSFDFIQNKNQAPMAMVIFEFEHHFTQDDLVKMWQGVLPSEPRTDAASGIQAAAAEIDIGINLQSGSPFDTTQPEFNESMEDMLEQSKGFDLLNDIPGESMLFPKNIQWMVFKVKQKAAWSYDDIVVGNNPPTPPPGQGPGPKPPSSEPINYNYNWPYDFFSLIELVKINETVSMTPREKIPDTLPTIIDMLNILPFTSPVWEIPPVSNSITQTDPSVFDKKELGFGAEVFKKQTSLNSEQFVTLQLIDQTSQNLEIIDDGNF